MEESLKDYIGKMMIGKSFRFLCNCIVSMDITGKIKDYEMSGNEIIFLVESNGKIIRIGENHPKLKIIPVK